MKRTICVVTTSRADYGLLFWLLKEIQNDPDLELQIIASGMHLSPEFGLTYQAIENDLFKIQKKVEMLLSADTETAIIKSLGVGLIGFAEALSELHPDMLVLLGDRFELLAAAISALILKIPIAHIHGGETSQGAVDEAIRHSITKIASIHFATTEAYRMRIIQMGENPEVVFNFGAPGLDNIARLKLMDKKELSRYLNFELDEPTALVTYHSVTLENNTAKEHIENILSAIRQSGLRAVFTKSNADTYGRIINKKIEGFCFRQPDKYRSVVNLGQLGYLSCLKHFDIMIGNSSSGLIEAPSFELPMVNIGDRQKGRIKAANVIDTNYTVDSIRRGIQKALSPDFKAGLKDMINPYQKYADGNISLRIKEKLKTIPLNDLLIKKEFRDLSSHA